MIKKFTIIECIITIVIIAILAAMLIPALHNARNKSIANNSALSEKQIQIQTIENANASIPIPTVSYFQERRTIAKWTSRWDKPNLPCYVYLVSFGNIIGYYVTDGKPSSTRSYILPEFKEVWRSGHGTGSSDSGLLVPTADLDGTYGNNNAGIRFFTAEGTAVEWAGDGASYLYSDAPLPLNVPKLNHK